MGCFTNNKSLDFGADSDNDRDHEIFLTALQEAHTVSLKLRVDNALNQ